MSPRKPTIAAIGAGRMGRGIAQVFAYAGHSVSLIDLKPRALGEARRLLNAARDDIAGNLRFLASLDLLTQAQVDAILADITLAAADEADAALAAADFAFEAVPELLDVKRQALGKIADATRPSAVIASTTSTILVDTLQEFVIPPERFLNAHWLNPAYLIPLVEVSAGRSTSPETIKALMTLLRNAGKVPVRCAPRPGFIVPRIQALALNEAARIAEEGVASPEEIDRAIRVGFGVRYAVFGLIEFIDWGGGDILWYASNYLRDALGSDRYDPPDVVKRNMQEGRLGLRTGRGFYDFGTMDVAEYQRETLRKLVSLLKHLDLVPPPGGLPGGD